MPTPDLPVPSAPVPSCPRCGGEMWDNREGKRNPRAPDFKCKDRSCDGVVWPPRTAAAGAAPVATAAAAAAATSASPAPGSSSSSTDASPSCPICGGPMWDDRATKRNPRAPDFKCKNKPKFRGGPGCEGVIWPPRESKSASGPASSARSAGAATSTAPRPPRPSSGSRLDADSPPPYDGPPPDDDDLLPF